MKVGVRIAATALLWVASASVVSAAYQQELARLDTTAQAFVQADSFVGVDAETLTDDHYYSAAHFPRASSTAVLWPDADLDALTRAVLILEANEAPLPHVRFKIQYSMNSSADFPEAQHDYIEVTRFNLGPARRADLLEYVSQEHVASATEFGVGPHVSWRFALAPVMGMRAGLLYASRKEVSDDHARNIDCLGEPCLSLADTDGTSLTWSPVTLPQLERAPYVDKSPLGSTRTARIVQELWATLSAHGMDPLPYQPDQPHFVFVTSRDVSGQDAVSFGVVKQAVVLDHSVQQIWTRRVEIADRAAELSQAYVARSRP